ncbi:hypothetical protein FIBSPDRAFT_1053887 [Athelia psychrophila]|uniref:G domain-containing protein n=1 Tax=Athelia psychrophila TaxID=1759441 RepID=A0A167W8J5_9AGAM|nr:hypothetical protein FIBSPDRAFT_1053887 [Fibularhizoctonia sp. CBS 109695]
MSPICVTGITVKTNGVLRSIVSVDLVDPRCRGMTWQANGKELRAAFPSPPELTESQSMTLRINYRQFFVSNSKDINFTVVELSTQKSLTRNFDEISVKVDTESIEPSQSTEPDVSAFSHVPLQPTTTEILIECPRFRILVIGVSGAGKSSLINTAFRVQKDEGQADVASDEAGEHDINKEITCRANQQFVLHDSQGFEGGEANNLAIVEKFLKGRGSSVDISEQVHAVWLCLPIPTTGGRVLETGVEKFLKLKTGGKFGKMPLITVFTKYDLLLESAKRRGGANPEKYAETMLRDACINPFKKYEAKGIPYMAVSSEAVFILSMIPKLTISPDERGHEKTLKDLIELTTAEVGKNLPEVAKIVLGVAQQISPKVKIESSIAVGKRRYWRCLGTSTNFVGKKLKDCLDVIRVDVVTVWAIEDPYNALILDLGGDLPDGRAESAGKFAGISAAAGLGSTGPAAPVLVPVVAVLTLAKWVYDLYQQIPDILTRLMAYVVNLVLVMQLLFLVLAAGKTKISTPLIKRVIEAYHDSDVKVAVQVSIKTYVTESGGFSKMGRDKAFDTVDGLLKRYCESKEISDLTKEILSSNVLAAEQSNAP